MRRKAQQVEPGNSASSAGLLRGVLAGPGHSLEDAFANLEKASCVERFSRHLPRNLRGARVLLSQDEGEGYWEFTQIGSDIYVIAANFAYKDPRVEFVPGDGLLQFYFKLSGDLTLAVSRTEPLRLNRPSLLVYNQPRGLDVKEWTAPSARERCVAITMHGQFLIDHFMSSAVDVPNRLQALVAGTPGEFQYVQLPLTSKLYELATNLVDNPYGGSLALIYTEAITLQLLCAAIAAFSSLTDAPTGEFSDRDLKCLHAARSFLMKQMAPAPTIRQVARAAGLNETALTRGFKLVFGETIFDFSVRCRMQHALTLLRERRMPVRDIAGAVGYGHQTSFATAFRRHFGLRPRDVRVTARSS